MSLKFSIVKKLSVKTILSKKPKAPDDGKTEWLCQIAGVAQGIKTGNSNLGDWTALTGAFQGTNLETGIVFRSGTCFLPDVALDLITPGLLQKETKGIEFAFNIGVKHDDSSTTKYVYVVEPIFEAAENDPLEMMIKKLPAGKSNAAQLEHGKKKA